MFQVETEMCFLDCKNTSRGDITMFDHTAGDKLQTQCKQQKPGAGHSWLL